MTFYTPSKFYLYFTSFLAIVSSDSDKTRHIQSSESHKYFMLLRSVKLFVQVCNM